MSGARTHTHTHSALTHSVQTVKWPSHWTCNLFSSPQVHPDSRKSSLRPSCNCKLVHRYTYSSLQDAQSFLRSWWYHPWTRQHLSLWIPTIFPKLQRVLRLPLFWSTRTSSTIYSISLTSIEYYVSIYSQVFRKGLFHLSFQKKMLHAFIPFVCVLHNQPSSSSLIWSPQSRQECKLWITSTRQSNYSTRNVIETVL